MSPGLLMVPADARLNDDASVHSLPATTVPPTPPPPPSRHRRRPSTGHSSSTSDPHRPLRSSPSAHTLQPTSRSASRLSGFFTNLIHRRDAVSPEPIPEDHPLSPPDGPSRPPSPLPLERTLTPPPSLPPPTLQELGLSLSVLTTHLAPSHFTSPPSSGAFLAPHYLLLCHPQGLDVLPILSPPTIQPYALVRRVPFKSVVVMEHRGVLVAIAGRRDGVRVYALEDVRKAIEWRIDIEVRRERDRTRRDVKKLVMNGLDVATDTRHSSESRKASLSTPPPGHAPPHATLIRKASYNSPPVPSSSVPQREPAPQLIPRSPTSRMLKKPRLSTTSGSVPPEPSPSECPPPYTNSSVPSTPTALLQRQHSSVSLYSRRPFQSTTLLVPPLPDQDSHPDVKPDWAGSSDEEAIDIVAAGSSGSQALDERTSATFSSSQSPNPAAPSIIASSQPTSSRASVTSGRRRRPSNLDLTVSLPNTPVVPSEPSPSPTLQSLRQALSHSPTITRRNFVGEDDPRTSSGPPEDDDDEAGGGISLAQALLESRIPDLPPLGTRRPQQPILLGTVSDIETGLWGSGTHDTGTVASDRSHRRRRRWSVLLGSPPIGSDETINPVVPTGSSRTTFRSAHSQPSIPSHRPSTSPQDLIRSADVTEVVDAPPLSTSLSTRSSRFFPRLITNALSGRRSDERPALPASLPSDGFEIGKRIASNPLTPHAPPPKLEYVKLPGTKGALMIKAVETPKKSFLAILCGENGEKVELFAGTYRTALGLSRTFILPDSPRSLELQLQGDDLVEVFLVFSQNVFGLEPATVRVREVRIGRAERRAARRRAREVRAGEGVSNDSEVALGEETTNVNVSVSVAVSNNTGGSQTPPLIPTEHPDAHSHSEPQSAPNDSAPSTLTSIGHSEELMALAAANIGPYTTFQQLNFAPRFPLASIADEYIIPPTYATFLEYRTQFEPEEGGGPLDLTQVQFSPPGLPVPVPTAPSRWYYRDPKGVVHGPWKASLMQAWYKDGLLPPDLPVRREEDEEYMLLKDLRLQSVDPTHPFRPPPPPPTPTAAAALIQDSTKPLLSPVSLLAQPRHFGPPALFYSSRGGHSTTIVDARGRSVLKGRFVWSSDSVDESRRHTFRSKMGDIKRLETLDIQDRAVLVAMRKGGLEAVDLGDALLRPADESRTVLPQFAPSLSCVNRRAPYVWKIGNPVSGISVSPVITQTKSSGGSTISTIPGKKLTPNKTDFALGEGEPDSLDEVLFLGRKEDEIYICERSSGSFRILKLCPSLLP